MNTTTENSFSGEIPTSFRSTAKMPFNDSATATKKPKDLPGQPKPTLFSKFRAAVMGKEEIEMEETQTALLLKQASVREMVENLNHRRKDVENAETMVANAAAEFEELKTRRAYLTGELKKVWGELSTFGDMRRVPQPPDRHYGCLSALDAAIADYPNAQRYLSAKLVEAQKALAAFKKANDLAGLPED